MQIKILLSEYLKRNRGVILFLVCFVFVLSFYANCSYFFNTPKQLAFFPPFIEGLNLNYNKHLGAEYYFIAQALAAGKGFSNPFQVETGPTAWMPPLYPFFLALLITLFHSTLAVACIIVFLKNVVLVVAGLVIYGIAQRTARTIKAQSAVALYIVLLLNDFGSFFQITHDTWIVLLFYNHHLSVSRFFKKTGWHAYNSTYLGARRWTVYACKSCCGSCMGCPMVSCSGDEKKCEDAIRCLVGMPCALFAMDNKKLCCVRQVHSDEIEFVF